MGVSRRRPYLVCYDIGDPWRLQRIHAFVSSQAAMVQYSVYYLEASRAGIEGMAEGLRARCNPMQDDLRIYPLPKRADFDMLGSCAADLLPGTWFGRRMRKGQ